MSDLYKLDGQTPVQCKDLVEWGIWFEAADRRVAQDFIEDWYGKPVQVSTVFLGIDYGWGEGPPVLFETLVFGGKLDQLQERCCTWDEAVKQHQNVLAQAKAALVE